MTSTKSPRLMDYHIESVSDHRDEFRLLEFEICIVPGKHDDTYVAWLLVTLFLRAAVSARYSEL